MIVHCKLIRERGELGPNVLEIINLLIYLTMLVWVPEHHRTPKTMYERVQELDWYWLQSSVYVS